jgi:hypothetical protein
VFRAKPALNRLTRSQLLPVLTFNVRHDDKLTLPGNSTFHLSPLDKHTRFRLSYSSSLLMTKAKDGFSSDLGNGHWNAVGHRVAGELIAQKLKDGVLGK